MNNKPSHTDEGIAAGNAQPSRLSIEHALGTWVRGHSAANRWRLALFILFKQAWAALFGVLILIGIIASKMIWQPDWILARYDALLIYALLIQCAFLILRLETLAEARVILLFHATGTFMEWFKVSAGSWSYPEEAIFKIFGVPLFSGFMYASVGSYIARSIRLFDMKLTPWPPLWLGWAFGASVYINFFAHHFVTDIRILLFIATLLIFWKTKCRFKFGDIGAEHRIALPIAALLPAIALWGAESVGTVTGTWLYSGQIAGTLASPAKIGSWYLLLWVSLLTVLLTYRRAITPDENTNAAQPAEASSENNERYSPYPSASISSRGTKRRLDEFMQ